MHPTAVVDNEHIIVFLDKHEAMMYWSFLPGREFIHVIDLIPDPNSGGWIIPRFD
jgi:hypothetical protein